MPSTLARTFAPFVAVAMAVASAPLALAQNTIAWFEMKGAVTDRAPELASLFGGGDGMTLRGVVSAIERAGEDGDVAAIVVRISDLNANLAQIHEIGRAIGDARENGKTVHAFTEIYGPAELMLASFCDDVIVQKGGAVMFPGLYMEEMFLADTLAWVGAKADFVQVGDYKGASEQFANSQPSKAWDQNISRLLDSMWAAMQARLMEGRNLSEAQLNAALEEAWLGDPQSAIRAGLIDAEVDRLDLDARLKSMHGDEITYRVTEFEQEGGMSVNAANPFAIFEMLSAKPKTTASRETIAVLHIDAQIVDGESAPASFMGGASVGSTTIRKALKQIEDDDLIKGLVVRVHSPGGSAIASESMWIGLRRVAEKKPVWVSVGDMAASGGYYCAVGGDKIYVEPTSIVGSIGVVGGKIVLGGTYEKAHINIVPRGRGPLADMMSTVQPWSERHRDLVRRSMVQIYDQFVDRVQRGREGIDIAKTAEGRLFVGKDAIELKMADELGGLTDAIEDMAGELSLRDGRYDVMDFPRPRSFEEVLGDLFGQFGVSANADHAGLSAAAAMAKEVLGENAWTQLRESLGAFMQLRDEPVILVSPRVLLFR
ncbi:MAG: S49 family peptidase [Phycisphaerales bacterium]